MKRTFVNGFIKKLAVLAIGGLVCCSSAKGDSWAARVVSSNKIGTNPLYSSVDSVLGKPSTLILDPGIPPSPAGTYRCSMVYGPFQTDPDGNKLVTTITEGGHITVEFDQPILDDPENWYGQDFIVFGNCRFVGIGAVTPTTNMESYAIKNGIEHGEEPMTVSVSQDGVTWYEYTNGPYVDDYAPTQAWAWDWVSHNWSNIEMDFTKPVDPTLTPSSFGYKSAAAAIDLYKGSAGGTSFDISSFNLPVDPATGFKWIKYIKVTANVFDEWGFASEGEIDAFARVSHRTAAVSVLETKQNANADRVVLENVVVTAGTFETGTCCYVEGQKKTGAIKVLGRVMPREQVVTIYGNMDTIDNERVVRATGVEVLQQPLTVSAVGMSNKQIGGADYACLPTTTQGQKGITGGTGINNIGMLVRTWGTVKSVDSSTKSFVVDDGSGRTLKCIAPRNPATGVEPLTSFTPPVQNAYVVVTGISSLEDGGSSNLVPLLRLRAATDVAVCK